MSRPVDAKPEIRRATNLQEAYELVEAAADELACPNPDFDRVDQLLDSSEFPAYKSGQMRGDR